MMRIVDALTLTSLFWMVSSAAGPAQPSSVEIGRAFTLPVGGTALVGQTGLRVGFDAVNSDSRCPKGAQCVWAGEASIRVWLQQGGGDRHALDLHLPAHAGPVPQALGHQVSLVRLDPEPISGKPIAEADYRATLLITSSPQTTPASLSEK